MNRYNIAKRNAEIVRLYKNGFSADSLAKQFRLGRRQVYYILAKNLTDETDTTHRIEQQAVLERDFREKEKHA